MMSFCFVILLRTMLIHGIFEEGLVFFVGSRSLQLLELNLRLKSLFQAPHLLQPTAFLAPGKVFEFVFGGVKR